MQPGHHASGMSRIEIPAIVCARIEEVIGAIRLQPALVGRLLP
jgi:hypothetical protein